MADGVIGNFESLSLNKFFDRSTPSMRKGDNGEEKKTEKKKENTSLAAPGALPAMPYRLLNQKWPTGGPKFGNRVWKRVQS